MAGQKVIRKLYKLGGLKTDTAYTEGDRTEPIVVTNLTRHPNGGLTAKPGTRSMLSIGDDVLGSCYVELPASINDTSTTPRAGMLIARATGSVAGRIDSNLYLLAYGVEYQTTNASAPIDRTAYVTLATTTHNRTLRMYPSPPNGWKMAVTNTDTGALLGTVALSTFYYGGSPITITQLATALAAYDITLTPTNVSGSASCLVIPSYDVAITPIVNPVCYAAMLSPISEGGTVSANTALAAVGTVLDQETLARMEGERWRVVSTKRRVYFANYKYLMKWDGYNAFPAGVAAPTGITLTAGGATGGTLADGAYHYAVTFSVKDAQGYELESIPFDCGNVTIAGGPKPVTVGAISGRNGWLTYAPSGAPWTSWGCVAAGATVASTTITVDNGAGAAPNVDTGDTVYFYDSVSASYVERMILGVTKTGGGPWSITVSGAAVSVADNAPISPNVRINIYRSKVGPSSLDYWIASIPSDVTGATQSYVDSLPDASMTAANYDYASPLVDSTPLVSNKISALGAFAGSLLVGEAGRIRWSDASSPEIFPDEMYADCDGEADEIATIVGGNDSCMFGSRTQLWNMTGTPANGDSTIRKVASTIGCANSDAMVWEGGAFFWTSDQGVFSGTGGSDITRLSDDIHGFWTQKVVGGTENVDNMLAFSFRTAVAYYDAIRNCYRVNVGWEDTLEYDVRRREWRKWTNNDWSGGVALLPCIPVFYYAPLRVGIKSFWTGSYAQLWLEQPGYPTNDGATVAGWVLRFQFDDLEFAQKKLPLRIRVLADRPSASFPCVIKTYINNSTTASTTSDTMTISSASDYATTVKVLDGQRVENMSVRLGDVSGTDDWYYVSLAGIEVEYEVPFAETIKSPRS